MASNVFIFLHRNKSKNNFRLQSDKQKTTTTHYKIKTESYNKKLRNWDKSTTYF